MARRVLITGASGLLGRAIYQAFHEDKSWQVLGLAFSRAQGELKKVDITDPDQVHDVIDGFKPTVIIHSAAERRPDVVEHQEDATKKLNVEATKVICQEAAQVGAVVVYISTDYVFDGKNPPYQVDDNKHPLSKYGHSKSEGEEVTLESKTDNIVLRVPILYGNAEALDESAVTILFPKVKDSSKKFVASDYERRYPTHCGDVAGVLKELSQKRLEDPTLKGVFHWSADENITKYDMAITMAKVFNLPTDHIIPDKTPSTNRPYDAHLDSTRIEKLGIIKRRPFKDGIEACLKPYL